jgi:hypothetical protein
LSSEQRIDHSIEALSKWGRGHYSWAVALIQYFRRRCFET